MSEDERALRARLAALEAEVQAETQAKADVRRTAARSRDAEVPVGQSRGSELEDLGGSRPQRRPAAARRERPAADDVAEALALARKAVDVKEELTRPRAEHEKSWLLSGALSLVLGPIGWLYAGSFREAAPAALAYLLLALATSTVLPIFLMLPVLGVLLPLSGIAGVVYALTYNRHGERQRLFEKDKSKGDDETARRQLPPSKS